MNRRGLYEDRWKQLVSSEAARRRQREAAATDPAAHKDKKQSYSKRSPGTSSLGLLQRCRALVRRYPVRSLAASCIVLIGYAVVVLAINGRAYRGCVNLVTVSGVVTLDGEPIANILVHFQPTSETPVDREFSPSSHGVTDAKGRYELEWVDGRGAVIGEHIVTLVHRDRLMTELDDFIEKTGEVLPRDFKLPPEARDGSQRFVVPDDGTEEANFAFESSQD